ncbi:MAG: gliding motility-associated C-terminal domain-containing protein, partial [Saprospiraceae bacterium]|nr:gliding motility-associated C-terminal domain-containing protein [Saprospiraceae bacterium]
IAYEWDTGDDTQLVDGLATGTYEVTVTNEDGCLDTTFVEITQPDSPVEVDISLADAISCAGEADGILQANVSGPGFSFNYNWSSGSTNSAAQGLPTGDYSVTVTNERGCEATNDFFLDEPAPINAMISPIDITCLDPDNGGIILIDTVTGGTGRYEYSIDGIIYSNASGFFNLFAGTYDISIRDEEGCESIFPITVMGPPELVVSLGEDIEITQGETIEIEALTNIGGELVFTWTPRDTINAGADNMIEVQPIESTVFQVVVEDTVTLCTATDQINVVVNRDRKIFVPNVFSPNNDGSNDVLMIQSGVGVEEIESYRIFDRNGALVYEQTNFQPNDPYFGWDGRFRGQDLNTGVYVYVAEIRFIDGLTEVFKGDVLLMR